MLSLLLRAERVAAGCRQLGNVRSALEWSLGSHGSGEIGTRLAVASTQLFEELSLLDEWQSWTEQLMTAGYVVMGNRARRCSILTVGLLMRLPMV
jgi:hypothetical protein